MKPENTISTETLVFRSRIDMWLVILVFAPQVAGLTYFVQRGLSQNAALPIGLYLAIGSSLAFGIWLFLSTSYHVSATELLARSGPFRVRVPLAQIKRVRHSNSFMSAPALSRKRLEVEFGRGKSVSISPDDEEGFLTAMKKRAPQAELPAGDLE